MFEIIIIVAIMKLCLFNYWIIKTNYIYANIHFYEKTKSNIKMLEHVEAKT